MCYPPFPFWWPWSYILSCLVCHFPASPPEKPDGHRHRRLSRPGAGRPLSRRGGSEHEQAADPLVLPRVLPDAWPGAHRRAQGGAHQRTPPVPQRTSIFSLLTSRELWVWCWENCSLGQFHSARPYSPYLLPGNCWCGVGRIAHLSSFTVHIHILLTCFTNPFTPKFKRYILPTFLQRNV